MSSTKVHNFSAGPCILPKEVFEKASQAVLDLEGSGLSILEMSHRSKPFEAVMAKAQGLVKELLGAPDNYEVVFLGGGASLGFHLIPLNYMRPNGKAAYANTGEWAGRAIKESARVGETLVVASSEDKNFSYIPKGFEIPNDADYFHFTSNNTIFGTQFKAFPKSPVPMICDMSSDIFSRPVNVKDFALIYGGAQKNMGPAGATVYLMDPERLGKSDRKISPVLDLKNHAAKGSMYNTPPVYAVYVSMLTLQWMKDQGGVVEMERRNAAKAKLLYDAVDRLPLFQGTTAVEDRSVMNPTFVMKDAALEPAFDELWKAAGINGIRGHRSVGGYRASMYNALPIESVQVLVDVMDEFAKKRG
ncbi:MAG: 3-phosphoserine/phosphohydroxythreonine transaminase [Flavobacteriales bacterium]|jgi:phosphoserine aminotransferase|nr:3-phosphoserine/phosphohydroxythreonine transaminase [Flavobacteriales bacterium]MBK6551708.1 3-phosphoserine/phosphohydroxythreonine transaminase [Flavobacteriales bacterium]MBK6882236.1 3-phosphoserine/phosphohydroxythreonine transaminase [Flavobacteriales bacterium]MBK7101547.1 3-phosphoserine/phosphohydroxythreonine transaminase [Flavobacteriales bacterium]MBK7112253.1 3-phosphoserine/phosphohydroxythreonine transaminase [Flavobacteriales bacterium]